MILVNLYETLLRWCGDKQDTYDVVVLDNGFPPIRATDGAAGYDVKAKEFCEIKPGQLVAIPLGVSIRPPPGTYIRTVLRSSVTRKQKAIIPADVVDADYTGEIHCFIRNIGTDTIQFNRGERFCQLVFVRISNPRPVIVASLPTTERGQGGQGSTGQY